MNSYRMKFKIRRTDGDAIITGCYTHAENKLLAIKMLHLQKPLWYDNYSVEEIYDIQKLAFSVSSDLWE